MSLKDEFIDIFVPDHSRGLMVDALILKSALEIATIRVLSIPLAAMKMPAEVNATQIQLEPRGRIAVFVECVFEHPMLDYYMRKVFLPNPEWLFQEDFEKINRIITEFWHKTMFGYNMVQAVFPNKLHTYIGFTSLPREADDLDYESCFHTSGIRPESRHTQTLVDTWLDRPDFPPLNARVHWAEMLRVPRWVTVSNLRLFLGDMSDEEYEFEFSRSGIHICTSQMEGFGHYINEARSMGALVVTVGAPPMSELITWQTGILIRPEASEPHGCGTRNIVSGKAIEQAVEEVLAMNVAERRARGALAKEEYLKDRSAFRKRIERCF